MGPGSGLTVHLISPLLLSQGRQGATLVGVLSWCLQLGVQSVAKAKPKQGHSVPRVSSRGCSHSPAGGERRRRGCGEVQTTGTQGTPTPPTPTWEAEDKTLVVQPPNHRKGRRRGETGRTRLKCRSNVAGLGAQRRPHPTVPAF